MKYYEIDLTKLVPSGIPLNSKDEVVSRGAINEFFLRSFETWFKQLFKVENGELILDYSRSCSKPNSMDAVRFCTDEQLKDIIESNGFNFYSENSHENLSQFASSLENTQWGTLEWANAIVQYVSNSNNVTGQITPSTNPYHYTLTIEGDIISTVNSETIKNRLLDLLQHIGTVHTVCDEISIIDETPIQSNLGGYSMTSILYEATII